MAIAQEALHSRPPLEGLKPAYPRFVFSTHHDALLLTGERAQTSDASEKKQFSLISASKTLVATIDYYPSPEPPKQGLPDVFDFGQLTAELATRANMPLETAPLHAVTQDLVIEHWRSLSWILNPDSRKITTPTCFKEVLLDSFQRGGVPDVIGVGVDGVIYLVEVSAKKATKEEDQDRRSRKNRQIKESEKQFRKAFGAAIPVALVTMTYAPREDGAIHLTIRQPRETVVQN